MTDNKSKRQLDAQVPHTPWVHKTDYVQMFMGQTVKEAVTGVEGIVTTVNYHLNGCVMLHVQPPMPEDSKDGKVPDGHWFDVERVEIVGSKPVSLTRHAGDVEDGPPGSEAMFRDNGPAS